MEHIAGSPRPDNQPDATYFATMAAHASEHWWYRSRWALMEQVLRDRVPAGATALDIGCGTGELLDVLTRCGATLVAGTDLSEDALGHARHRVGAGTIMASLAEAVPFATGCADVVVSLEVLEHLDEPAFALREYHRVLRPGGTLLVTVPAYQSLWGAHDVAAGHRRRYRLRELRAQVSEAGFDVEEARSYFSFLVPPAFLVRRTPLRRLVNNSSVNNSNENNSSENHSSEDDASAGRLVSAVFGTLAAAERALLARGLAMPFGLSMFVVARRAVHPGVGTIAS